MWIAVYVHHLLKFPRNGPRTVPWIPFDTFVFQLVEQIGLLPLTVDYQTDTVYVPEHARPVSQS